MSELTPSPIKNFIQRHSIFRLLSSITAGIIAAVISDIYWGWAVSVLTGWNVTASLLIFYSWYTIYCTTPQLAKARAAIDDPGRTLVTILVSISSVVSLFASAVVLRQAKTIAPKETYILVASCITAVTLSWCLTHTAFLFHYARMYYRGEDDVGGLVFPGDTDPDDFDFAYFAFTLGMAFQVSDVSINRSDIRRFALFHGLLSFAYNTVLVGLTLNVFFGIIG